MKGGHLNHSQVDWGNIGQTEGHVLGQDDKLADILFDHE